MSNYNNLISELKDLAYSFNMGYIRSFSEENTIKRESIFAHNMIHSLNEKKDLLRYLGKLHRVDLNDCIVTHGNKYVRIFETTEKTQDEISIFKNKITGIVKALEKKEEKHECSEKELILIGERLYKIIKNIQLLFAVQAHNKQAKDSLQSLAITFGFSALEYNQQNELQEKLLQIKELWEINSTESADSNNIKYKFHCNPAGLLKLDGDKDPDTIFDKVIDFFIEKHPELHVLSDEQIIHIYDRLKNLENPSPSITRLLNKIHKEAQFRYSYNRLSDSGYELLNKFQSFDTLVHKIDNLEFSIMESYLINKDNLIKDILKHLAKHTDNIIGLSLGKDENLKLTLKKIETKIDLLTEIAKKSTKTEFSSTQSKLASPLGSNIQKKYIDLDKFTKLTLQNRYRNLFRNIDIIIEDKEVHREYMQELLVKKLTKDFYLPNLSNSIEKLRKMEQYRIEVTALLSQFCIIDIFLKKDSANKIKSLDFKETTLSSDVQSAKDYVQKLVSGIIANCSAMQLESFTTKLVKNKKYTEIQTYIKNTIIREINNRTSLGKMMFSIVKGGRKDNDLLKSIKALIEK